MPTPPAAPVLAAITQDGPPFARVPADAQIADWFVREAPKEHGCEGIDLWRGPHTSYCYLWITATVDLDMSYFWLLDIRTAGTEPLDEVRDFLFVAQGAEPEGPPITCNRMYRPIDFKASVAEHRAHLADGLAWFHECVMHYVNAEPVREATAPSTTGPLVHD